MEDNVYNTGNDFEAFVREELKKIVQEQNKQQQSTAPAETTQDQPKPITVNIGGKVFSFENEQQLSVAVNQAIASLQAELQKAQQQQQQAPGSYVSEDEPPPFSFEKYVNLLKEDPIAAANYLDSYRFFGGRVENPAAVIKEKLEEAEKANQMLAVYRFREAHPEYPGGPKAAEILESIRQELGVPFTLEGLEAALGVAQSRGLLPTREQWAAYIQQQMLMQQQQMQQAYQQAPVGVPPMMAGGITPPPSAGRTQASVPASDIIAQAEQLEADDIARLIQRLESQMKK